MKHQKITWDEVNSYVASIAREITISGWRPDIIVGLTRGGLAPAVMLSHYFGIPMQTLKVSLRDDPDTELNITLVQEALAGQRILIVDDINDTGATIAWIKENWANDADLIWTANVRFAVLIHNYGSSEYSDFMATAIDKRDDDVWIDFPWEKWWST